MTVRALRVAPPGRWPSGEAADRVVLTWHDRHRRRLRLVGEGGTALLLDLAQPALLVDGDGLALEDGRWVAVAAAAEPVAEVTGLAQDLLRYAWHVGNRHFPAQLLDGRMLIPDDHVIVDMLRGLGATVRRTLAPFTPEGGAYAPGGHGPARESREGHRHLHGSDGSDSR